MLKFIIINHFFTLNYYFKIRLTHHTLIAKIEFKKCLNSFVKMSTAKSIKYKSLLCKRKLGEDELRSKKKQTILLWLCHSYSCSGCNKKDCREMKKVLSHKKKCPLSPEFCLTCKTVNNMFIYHKRCISRSSLVLKYIKAK